MGIKLPFSGGVYQKVVKTVEVVAGLLDPSAPMLAFVLMEAAEAAGNVKEAREMNPKNADRKNVVKYSDNLKAIDEKISTELVEVIANISSLEQEEDLGNTGVHREEIASQTKQKWELEYQQIAVQTEIKVIEEVLEEPIINQ